MGAVTGRPPSPQECARQAREEQLADQAKLLKSCGVTQIRLIKEFAAIAFSSIDDYIDVSEGGEILARSFEEIKTGKTGKKSNKGILKLKAIKKVKEHTRITESADGEKIWKDSRVEFELYDKLDALKYLTKLGGWEPAEKKELSGPNGGPIPIEDNRIDVVFVKPGEANASSSS